MARTFLIPSEENFFFFFFFFFGKPLYSESSSTVVKNNAPKKLFTKYFQVVTKDVFVDMTFIQRRINVDATVLIILTTMSSEARQKSFWRDL